MNDEIERLQEAKRRALALADERAVEANKLRAENERMRRALEAFARLADLFDPDEGDDKNIVFGIAIEIGELRAARAALYGDQQ